MAIAKKNEKIIEFLCCYCGCSVIMPEPITTSIRGGGKYGRQSWLKKSYCSSLACEKCHRELMKKPGARAEYRRCLQRLRNRLRWKMVKARGQTKMNKTEKIVLYKKGGHLFRDGGVDLGRIVGEWERSVDVQKYSGASIQSYRKECIRE